jgi:1-phosphofructokinase family hexose kinase
VIVTVTPNPAIDITLTVDRLNPGHTHRVAPGARRAGGKGINVARVLTTMGADAVAIAPVGTLDRDWFSGDLGVVPSVLVEFPGNVRQSTALVEPHQTTVFNETGVNPGPRLWSTLIESIAAQLDSASCLVISGSVPPDAPPSLYGELVALGRARGIPVIADATGAALLSAVEAGATVVKPNASELTETTGETDPVAGARALQSLGAELVLVSLGEDGMVAVPKDPQEPVLHARLGRVLAGNPTGAGDAGVAGVASVLEQAAPASGAGERSTLDMRAVLVRATAWSAAAVLEPLAGSVDPARVAEIEADLHITTLPLAPAPTASPAESDS